MKLAMFAAVCAAVVIVGGKPSMPEDYYENFGIVTEINPEFHEVIFMELGSGTVNAPNGMVWAFDGEGFKEGEPVHAIMYNNGTPSVLDDEVVEVWR